MRIDELARDIGALTLLEAAELARALGARLGIDPSSVTPRDDATGPRRDDPPVVAPPPEYSVELTAVGERKVQVMRVLRERANMALTEARATLDRAPVLIAHGLARADADALRAELEQVGATVTVRT